MNELLRGTPRYTPFHATGPALLGRRSMHAALTPSMTSFTVSSMSAARRRRTWCA